MNCELVVPAHPETAAGLASPYLLTGPGGESPAASGCQQSNPNLQAFVQATILNPATGRLWVYEPLVTTLGSPPAVAPVVPKLPKGAVVNLMVGFNGNDLQLVGALANTLTQARCVERPGRLAVRPGLLLQQRGLLRRRGQPTSPRASCRSPATAPRP